MSLLKCLGTVVVVNVVPVDVNAVVDDDTKVLFTWKFSVSYMNGFVGAVNAVMLELVGIASVEHEHWVSFKTSLQPLAL